MKLFISVVSHCHSDLIRQLSCLNLLALDDCINVVVKDNVGEASLREYCIANNIHYIDQLQFSGFGENNNYVYSWCSQNLGLTDDDFFLVLNPDVLVDTSELLSVVKLANESQAELSTVNLYKDSNFSQFDFCVRGFPSFVDFFASYAGFGNKTVIDKSNVKDVLHADWAAGSFLLFKASLYRKLGGFDPGYFMYCEDIDICWRAQKLFNQKVLFSPDIKAIHHAQHANRSLFSKHFLWHLKSVARYLLMIYGLRKPYYPQESL